MQHWQRMLMAGPPCGKVTTGWKGGLGSAMVDGGTLATSHVPADNAGETGRSGREQSAA